MISRIALLLTASLLTGLSWAQPSQSAVSSACEVQWSAQIIGLRAGVLRDRVARLSDGRFEARAFFEPSGFFAALGGPSLERLSLGDSSRGSIDHTETSRKGSDVDSARWLLRQARWVKREHGSSEDQRSEPASSTPALDALLAPWAGWLGLIPRDGSWIPITLLSKGSPQAARARLSRSSEGWTFEMEREGDESSRSTAWLDDRLIPRRAEVRSGDLLLQLDRESSGCSP